MLSDLPDSLPCRVSGLASVRAIWVSFFFGGEGRGEEGISLGPCQVL